AEDEATRSKPSAAANAPNERLSATIIGVTGASNVAATPNVARARAMDIKDLAKDPMLNSPILANASAKTFIAAAITKIDADDAKPPFMRFKATTNSVSAIAIAPNALAKVSRSSDPSSFIGSTSKFIAADITVTATEPLMRFLEKLDKNPNPANSASATPTAPRPLAISPRAIAPKLDTAFCNINSKLARRLKDTPFSTPIEPPNLLTRTANAPSSVMTTPRETIPFVRLSRDIDPSALTLLARILTAVAINIIPVVPLVIRLVVLLIKMATVVSSARVTVSTIILATKRSGSMEEIVLSAADNINIPADMATKAVDIIPVCIFFPVVTVEIAPNATDSSRNNVDMATIAPVNLSGFTRERTTKDAAKIAIALAILIRVSAWMFLVNAWMELAVLENTFLTLATTP